LSVLTIDCETGLIKPGLLAPPLACVQFAIDDGPVAVAVRHVDPVHDILEELLRQPLIVGHNIAYDLLVIGREYPDLMPAVFAAYREDRVSDTQVREKLKAIANGNMWFIRGNGWSLETLAKRYKYPGGKDAKDPWRLRYMELSNIPYVQWPEAAKHYAVGDIRATRHVYLGQGDGQISPDEFRQARGAWAMHLIGSYGVQTDEEAINEFEKRERDQFEIDKRILYQTSMLEKSTGKRSVKAARERMIKVMAELGDEPALTDKGSIKLDEEACEKSGDPLLNAYQRFGSRQNLLTRIQALKAGIDAPINPYFDSLIETGRTSCAKGRPGAPTNGYQVQNMRRVYGERECFVPEAGNVFMASDYDSFELCTLAQCCLWLVGYSRLAEVLREGRDPHLAFGANMLGLSYEDALAIYKNPTHPRRKEVKRTRQGSKIADFGYPGGMGSASFRDYARGFGLHITEEESDGLLDGWHNEWPEMAGYFSWVNRQPWRKGRRKDRIVQVTDVEQLVSGRRRANITYTTTCNTFFQGLAADAAKDAAFQLVQEVELGSLHDWTVWNFVHDEFILEGPEEDGHRASEVVQRIMCESAQRWIPDVPIKATPALMRRWSKDAEAVYRDGVLVPWEPAQ
jgi:hypothetical protein